MRSKHRRGVVGISVGIQVTGTFAGRAVASKARSISPMNVRRSRSTFSANRSGKSSGHSPDTTGTSPRHTSPLRYQGRDQVLYDARCILCFLHPPCSALGSWQISEGFPPVPTDRTDRRRQDRQYAAGTTDADGMLPRKSVDRVRPALLSVDQALGSSLLIQTREYLLQ